MKKKCVTFILIALAFSSINAQSIYFKTAIGNAKKYINKNYFTLSNNVLSVSWVIKNKTLVLEQMTNKETNKTMSFMGNNWFSIVLQSGETLTSDKFKILLPPKIQSIKGKMNSLKKDDREDGEKIMINLYNPNYDLKIHWEVTLLNNSNYIRQSYTFIPKDSLQLDKLILLQLPNAGSEIKASGVVAGCTLIGNDMFFAIEHPTAHVEAFKNNIFSYVKLPNLSSRISYTNVYGVFPEDTTQMRRAFLYYVERERAVPYHQFLHYNSWFDISYDGKKLDENSCLKRIDEFTDSLIIKRKVPLDAFLFDDGWDDNKTLWQFNSGFPDGFKNLYKEVKKINSALGVWLSPFGGYDVAKEQRLAYGKIQKPPFETNNNGFSLSGTVYYKRFSDVTKNFVKKYDVKIFKMDGIGEGVNTVGADMFYEADINALLRLIKDVRKLSPSIYFSLTTGTWSSPYWLFYGDAIWRNGRDVYFSGEGDKREQYITYRDGQTYQNVVKKNFLYPQNSVMYHGICIANEGIPSEIEINEKNVLHDIWAFLATGTSLQELYINPHKLTSSMWNELATAAKWARNNESVLVDVHWIGGDPEKGEIYGHAAWSPNKGIIMLRNPSSKTKVFNVNPRMLLEIPLSMKSNYIFYNILDKKKKEITGENFNIYLQPFEVIILEGMKPDN